MSRTILFSVGLYLCTSTVQAVSVIQHKLEAKLNDRDTFDIVVHMKSNGESTVGRRRLDASLSKKEQNQAIHESMIRQSATDQYDVLQFVSEYSSRNSHISAISKPRSYWITNSIYIDAASSDLIRQMAQRSDVLHVDESSILETLPPPDVAMVSQNDSNPFWHVDNIQAKSIWNQGNAGDDVVVGIIDSGVRMDHESLRDSYIGSKDRYGWYDPYDRTEMPFDRRGHGSHVAGIIAGTTGTGIAPRAKWMACISCNRKGQLKAEGLIACGQFMLCPHDVHGENHDCSQAPAVVSNSWGTTTSDDPFYQQVVDAWRDAGIIPVFSMGNSGPMCGSGGSPGAYPNVIAVGASDVNNTIAPFSSRGPVWWSNKQKPDFVAPGHYILSASNHTTSSYVLKSGTSMACPVVTGAIALMLSKYPQASYEQIYAALKETANKQVSHEDSCDKMKNGDNNVLGHGLIQVDQAIAKLGNILNQAATMEKKTSAANTLSLSFVMFLTVVLSLSLN